MKYRLSLVLILASFLLPAALAQTWRGVIGGTVLDPSEKPVASAQVTLVSEDTNRRRNSETGAQGEFSVPLLPPGLYRVEIEREGYRKHVQSLTLLVNQEIHLDVGMLAGRQTEEIVVTGTRDLLRTDTAAVSTVIENRHVRGLPLDGRNYFELSLLAPGVVPAAQGSAGSVRGDVAINVNGAREDQNVFLLDGVYNGDPKLNGVSVTPSVDAIREFEVLTSTYDASFGRNAGGQINVVMQSGTNQFHGTAYEFFRNAALDVPNHFAPATEPDPKYLRNQFGFSLGGPVRQNRTFLFADYEGRRAREGITRITNVPTALERIGDFSQSPLPPIDLFTQAPFPGNRIPAERIHPVGRAIAALYPLPNRNVFGQNFVSSPTQRDDSSSFDVRLDHQLSRNSDLAFRYSFNDRNLYEPFTGPSFAQVPGYGDEVPRRSHNAMVSETHVFTPRLLNELRLAFNRVGNEVLQQNRDRSINREVGLPELFTNPRDRGLSLITLVGFSPLGDEYNNPQAGVTNSYQIIDQMTYARGRNLLKFGADIRVLQQNAFRDIQSRGFLTFFGITGNAVGDMLQGFPTVTGGAKLDNPQHLRTESYNFFAQNTYRARQNLVLSAGLRYEYNSPSVDTNDRANLYDPSRGSLVGVGTNGIPRSGYFADKNNLAPRVGLAWTPGGRGTVLRGGYGIYYDQSALAPGEGLYFNAPYFNLKLYVPFPPFVTLTLSDPFPANYPIPIPSSALALQRDLRTAYLQQWDFTVQQQLGRGRVAEVGYVGSKGTHLLSARDINQPTPSPVPQNLRPNPQFDDITILESRSNSNYHSLQARLQQRLTNGLSALAAYTFGKSIDDASGFFPTATDSNFPQDSRNVRNERGRSNFDVRHRLSLSYAWDLPIAKGKLWGGWQTFGVWTFQSGRPFTVALISDLDNSNTGRSSLGFGANDRPNVVGNPKLDNPTPDKWFNTAAFAVPPFGTFGNSGRNILDGPGLATINASLLKNTTLSERVTLQFRLEVFNLFNRTNYDQPGIFVGIPTFGKILSAQSPRHVQLALKLLF